jgi:lysophospholipase L1-like esterase
VQKPTNTHPGDLSGYGRDKMPLPAVEDPAPEDPSFIPSKQVVKINALLETLKLDANANIRALDFWSDFTHTDGTLKTELYSDKHLHLGPAGYEVFAARLKLALATD